MELQRHTLNTLFAQLGLESETCAVDAFIAARRPLAGDVALYRAPFWTLSQRAFLKEEIVTDADWSGVIDELNLRLS